MASATAWKRRLLQKHGRRGVQAFAERPDGSMVPFAPYPTPLFDEKGDLSGAVNMLLDISEQKEYEAHIELVMRELSYRSKNLITIVQSFALQLMKFCNSFPEFQEKFMARLHAMARMRSFYIAAMTRRSGHTGLPRRSQFQSFDGMGE